MNETSATVLVGPGAVIQADGKRYIVRRFDSTTTVIARNLSSGLDCVVALANVSSTSLHEMPTVDLATISESQWELAEARYRAVEEVARLDKVTRDAMAEIARRHDKSINTLYRWVADFAESGSLTALMRKTRSDQGAKKLDPAGERILTDVIAAEYLTDQKKRPFIVHRALQTRSRIAGLKSPSARTLMRRIDELHPQRTADARGDRKTASRLKTMVGSFRDVDTPNAVWQIDHTPLDVIGVDDIDRIALPRPWLTLAIDVNTRTVPGWYVSCERPGALNTGVCLATAINPKGPELLRLGVDYDWPNLGKPSIVHMDNAREFHGNMLSRACQQHGFDLQFRMLKKPEHGSHIERLLGTLNSEIHALPGSTFSNTVEKGEYRPEKMAVMTLSEIERWLAHLILGLYHHRDHSTLKMPPIKKYVDGILGDGTRPGIGFMPIAADPDRVRTDFLPFEERAIHGYGVELDGIFYQGGELATWIGVKNPDRRHKPRMFIFRRDPRDISGLLFFDPKLKRYFRIPYKDITRRSISLWELRAARKKLADDGVKSPNEDIIFRAIEGMRATVDKAIVLTTKQRASINRRPRAPGHQSPRQKASLPGVDGSVSAVDDDEYGEDEVKPYAEVIRLGSS